MIIVEPEIENVALQRVVMRGPLLLVRKPGAMYRREVYGPESR